MICRKSFPQLHNNYWKYWFTPTITSTATDKSLVERNVTFACNSFLRYVCTIADNALEQVRLEYCSHNESRFSIIYTFF